MKAWHPSHVSFPALARMPDALWVPLAVSIPLLLVGMLGLLCHQPWLFPSLGPTAFVHAEQPEHRSARFYSTVVGHGAGIVAGIVAVWVFNASAAPAVLSEMTLSPTRVGAAALAMLMVAVLMAWFKASHAPAAATTLLFALGSFRPAWRDVLCVVVGAILMGVLGEVMRRLRGVLAQEVAGEAAQAPR